MLDVQTHFDLTRDESPQSTNQPSVEEDVTQDTTSFSVRKFEVLLKHYEFLKKEGSPMYFITSFLKENGYGNETLFLRTMEKL